MNDPDVAEAIELERTADWRIKKLGENPDDWQSAEAAELLQMLADEVRGLAMFGSSAYREYQAICGWLDEFDGGQSFPNTRRITGRGSVSTNFRRTGKSICGC
jgi:hypothetical protein